MFGSLRCHRHRTAPPRRRALAVVLATAALTTTLPYPGSAQLGPPDSRAAAFLDLQPGDQVRLRLQDGSMLEGSVRADHPDSLQVWNADLGLLRLDPDEIETLDRLESRRYWLEGALIGGGVTGLIIGISFAGGDEGFLDFGFEDGLAAGFVLGAPVGLLVGGLTEGQRWAPVIRPSTPRRTADGRPIRRVEVGVRWSTDFLDGS